MPIGGFSLTEHGTLPEESDAVYYADTLCDQVSQCMSFLKLLRDG